VTKLYQPVSVYTDEHHVHEIY